MSDEGRIEVCFLGVGAAVPAPGGTNCSYLVRAAGAVLLVDCGPAVLQQLAAAGVTPGDVTHLLVTHRHGDHILGYPMFLLWWATEGRGKEPPTVVAGSTTWESLRALWDCVYGEMPPPAVAAVALPDAEPSCHALTEHITLRTWPLAHSSFAPVLGLRLEMGDRGLAFTGDTAACAGVVELARGADLLVHDAAVAATVAPARPSSRHHCTARQAGEQAQAAQARGLALVHIGPEYEGREADLVEEARTAFTGRVFAPKGGDVVTLE
jgi:ribonuclease Z